MLKFVENEVFLKDVQIHKPSVPTNQSLLFPPKLSSDKENEDPNKEFYKLNDLLDEEILLEVHRISQLEFQIAMLKSCTRSDKLNGIVSSFLKQKGVKNPVEHLQEFKRNLDA